MPSLEVPDKFLWSDSRLFQDAAKRPNCQFPVQRYHTTGLFGLGFSLQDHVTAPLPDLNEPQPLQGSDGLCPRNPGESRHT